MAHKSIRKAVSVAALGGLVAGSAALLAGCNHDDAGHHDSTRVGASHSCKGQNACKGQGNCKTMDHSCKGQNACKGQGGCKAA